MKYQPVIWLFMTSRLKKGLKLYRSDGAELIRRAKPIYKDLLAKVLNFSKNITAWR